MKKNFNSSAPVFCKIFIENICIENDFRKLTFEQVKYAYEFQRIKEFI